MLRDNKKNITFLLQTIIGLLAYKIIAGLYLYRVFYFGFPGLFFRGNSIIGKFGIDIPTYIPFEKFSFILTSIVQPIFLLFIIPFIIAFILTYKLKWVDFQYSKIVKVSYIVVASLACLASVFYGYNYYFDQSHTIDRLIILVLFLASIRKPAYSFFFILFSFISWSQGNFLLGNNSITDERITFDIIILIVLFVLANRFYRVNTSVLFFLVSSVFLSSYYYSGLEKIYISPQFYNWAFENETSVGISNMIQFGWSIPLNINNGLNFYRIINYLQPYFGVFVIILELSVLFFFLNRKVTISIMAFILVFHFLVFILLGLFFIKWFIIASILLGIVLFGDKKLLDELFTKRVATCFFVLQLCITFFYEPSKLSWWDTRLSNHYEFYVKSDSSSSEMFQINSFAPYDKCLGFNRLQFMFEKTFLVVGDGTSNYNHHKNLKNIDYIKQRNSNKNIYFDSLRKSVFINFFKKYFKNRNKYQNPNFWKVFTFPRHVWANYKGENKFKPVKQIEIILKENYTNTKYENILLFSDGIQIDIDN